MCRKGKNRQLLTFLFPLHTFTESLYSKSVTYIQTFKLETFKHIKVHLHVQSHQLVHRSDTHCHGHIPDKWVFFCVHYCTEVYAVQ